MNVEQVLMVLDLARRMIDGSIPDKIQAAKSLAILALDFAENEFDLHAFLSETAQDRADAVVDAAEALKVGPR